MARFRPIREALTRTGSRSVEWRRFRVSANFTVFSVFFFKPLDSYPAIWRMIALSGRKTVRAACSNATFLKKPQLGVLVVMGLEMSLATTAIIPNWGFFICQRPNLPAQRGGRGGDDQRKGTSKCSKTCSDQMKI